MDENKQTRLISWIFALLALASTANVAAFTTCKTSQGYSAYPIQATAGYRHDKFGTYPYDLTQEFAAYISSFDSNDDDNWDGTADYFAGPEFVAYEIKRYPHQNDAGHYLKPVTPNRPSKWYKHADLFFLKNEQSDVTTTRINNSYSGVGNTWNRGHLAMKLHGTRVSQEADCNTHHFFNALPQYANFNQGIWLHLEALTGAWANKFGQVWVIAGPIYYPDREINTIGSEGEIPVAVPHAFFKIIIKESTDRKAPDILPFIYPNKEHPLYKSGRCSKDKDYDHTEFITDTYTIEELTGLSFFLNVDEKYWDELWSVEPDELWDVSEEYFGYEC